MKSLDPIVYRVVFALLAITSAASAAVLWSGSRIEHLSLEIVSDGELVEVMELDPSRPAFTREISSHGGYNAIEIDGKSVRMTSSDCGGGDCLRMSAAASSGSVIVCLPHKLVVRVVGRAPKGDIDGLSY